MIKKQDIAAPRTVQDMERRYKFGKTFAETMGLAKEASKAAEKAEETVESLDSEAVFNLLTENGTKGGFFIGNGENGTVEGDIYINAEFIKSGIIDAAVVQVVNLIAEKLKSVNADSSLEIDGAMLKYFFQGNETVNVKNSSIKTLTGAECSPVMYMTDRSEDGEAVNFGEYSAHHIRIGGTDVGSEGIILDGSDGNPTMALSGGSPIPLHWQSIGNGAHFLVGGTANIPDFIVEQGTSGIWTYRKWNSGKIELWTESISHTVSYSTISNYLYLSSFTVTVPLVTSVTYANIQETDWHYAQWTTTTRNSTNQIVCRYYSANTNGSGKTYTFMAHVIGTWK